MSPVRVFILVIAAIAAIALAFVLRGAFAGKQAAAPVAAPVAQRAAEPSVQVLTAAGDLPIGTRVSASDFTWAAWPAGALNPAFITDGSAPAPAAPSAAAAATKKASQAAATVMGSSPAQALEGSIVREPILVGEPITQRKLVRGGDSGYMAVVLSPGMRAMSVSVTVDTAAGGFILPGDRVDVMQSRQLEGGKGFTTETVLQNIRVLAVDQTTEAAKGSNALVGAVTTLEIPQGDAEVLARAQAEGKSGGGLVLALRSYADIGAPSGRAGGPGGAGSTIQVYRAGQASDVTVHR